MPPACIQSAFPIQEAPIKRFAASALLVFGLSTALAAEQAPQPPPTYEAAVLRTWKALHDSGSVLDELRHVTIGLQMTSAVARGEKFDFEAAEKAAASKPKTRASVVSEMEAAIAESYPLVEKSPSPRLVGWLDHQGEHYGKLVTAYRVNGIVPPVSRPK